MINLFTPEFVKWIFPSLKLDSSIVANRIIVKYDRMANSVDPDEMAR